MGWSTSEILKSSNVTFLTCPLPGYVLIHAALDECLQVKFLKTTLSTKSGWPALEPIEPMQAQPDSWQTMLDAWKFVVLPLTEMQSCEELAHHHCSRCDAEE